MNKKLAIILLLVLVCVAIDYLMLPASPKFSAKVFIDSKAAMTTRILTESNQWTKWFPQESSTPRDDEPPRSLDFNGYYFSIENALMNYAQVSITSENIRAASLLTVLEPGKDSSVVEWKGEISKTYNPLKRISSFLAAKTLENDLNKILLELKKYVESEKSVYGFRVDETKVVDTILISTKFLTDSFPTTKEIYVAINSLKKYTASKGAKQTNPPMLNVQKSNKGFRTMVALPLNKEIPERNVFITKRMVAGRIIEAEVNGGSKTAEDALRQLNLYVTDHSLSSPAIPFQSLVTDRSQEPDTTKWVTRIYYPIY